METITKKRQRQIKSKFNCPHCDFKTSRKVSLNEHLLSHDEDRLQNIFL